MDYYKRYMGDYGRDTSRLSMIEHGAYSLLLDDYYSTRSPLPADLDALYRVCRAMTKQEQAAVKSVANHFFPVGQDGLRHSKRADEEIAKWEELTKEASESGKRGSSAKWGPKSDDAHATRAQRLAAARKLATHTTDEWSAMLEICEHQCVRCHAQAGGARGALCKDHIVPIYQGGSDGIENLQPMCSKCNSSKGPDRTDFRAPDWRERLTKCLAKCLADAQQNALRNGCRTPSAAPGSPAPIPNPKPEARSHSHVQERAREGANGSVVSDPEGVLVDSLPYEQAIQATFPKGRNASNWGLAIHNAHQLVGRQLATWPELEEATERYARYFAANGGDANHGAHNFFDPQKQLWSQPWDPPRTKGQLRQDANLDAGLKWLAESGDT